MAAKNSIGELSPDMQKAGVALVETEANTCTLTIPDSAQLSESIRLSCGASAEMHIVVGKRARAIVVITMQPKQGIESSVYVHAGEESSVTMILVQHASDASVQISQHGHIENGAAIRWQNVTLGGASVTHDLRTDISGADAKSTVEWVCIARGKEKCSLSVHNVFLGKRGGGEITMKAVAEDHAHVTAKGMIEIGPEGGGTDTYLTQNVLMLDPTARVDAVPALEIKTNDVKASHAASIARVTPEDLFYLQSRGIVEREAKRMFVEGFVTDIISNIDDEIVREEILHSLNT